MTIFKKYGIYGHFTPTDPAIDFGLKVHPVCLPIASNSNPNKWRNQDVDILGFSTKDKGESSNRGDILKTARMKVFNQTICNNKLNTEKNKVKTCKSFLKEFKSLFFSHHVDMSTIKKAHIILKDIFKLGSSSQESN